MLENVLQLHPIQGTAGAYKVFRTDLLPDSVLVEDVSSTRPTCNPAQLFGSRHPKGFGEQLVADGVLTANRGHVSRVSERWEWRWPCELT